MAPDPSDPSVILTGIPETAIAAGAEAVNEAHAKRGWNKPAPWWTQEVATAVLEAAAPLLAEAWGAFESEPLRARETVTEHAHQMSGGGFHVWNTEPYIEKIYPLAERIKGGQRFGGKVYRRRVIVVEDWTEVEEKP